MRMIELAPQDSVLRSTARERKKSLFFSTLGTTYTESILERPPRIALIDKETSSEFMLATAITASSIHMSLSDQPSATSEDEESNRSAVSGKLVILTTDTKDWNGLSASVEVGTFAGWSPALINRELRGSISRIYHSGVFVHIDWATLV
jgi:hypothetical protein